MSPSLVYVGVDVSKRNLDVQFPGAKPWRIANTAQGVRALLERAARLGLPVQVCCEASGGYERRLMLACWEAEVAVCRLNAWQVRRYAQAMGRLAKTDRIDAQLIAQFAAHQCPQAEPLPETWRRELAEIWGLRTQLVAIREQQRNRLEHITTSYCLGVARKQIAALNRQIAALERQAQAVIGEQPQAAAMHARFQQVKAIGPVTATAVLATAPEIGTLGEKRAAALAGLAPMCDDSGEHRGERHIQRGRAQLRRALYMAALVASRHNPILAPFYRRLRAAGKAPKVAIVAVMRKLIVLLDRIAANPAFVPVRASCEA